MSGMNWEIIDTGVGTAEENMQFDADLLESIGEKTHPILHLYEWKGDSATFGYFIEPAEFLNMEGVAKRSLNLAKRPTGGGIVFHVWDFAFSVLVPAKCSLFSENTLENYEHVNRGVLNAVREFLGSKKELTLTPVDIASLDESSRRFCMARPTKYDVMLEGRKIAGAAQRKRKEGFLHQGTIALLMPPMEYLDDVLKGGTKVKESMFARTMPLLGKEASQKELIEARGLLKELLTKNL
jgi:lipoate-protein ligase A